MTDVTLRIKGLNSKGEDIDAIINVIDISCEGMGFISERDFDDGDILYVKIIGKNYSSDVNLQIQWKDQLNGRYGARIISMAKARSEDDFYVWRLEE